jgi:hypothetical protein
LLLRRVLLLRVLLCGVLLYARVFWVDPDELEPQQLNRSQSPPPEDDLAGGFFVFRDVLQPNEKQTRFDSGEPPR